MIYRIDIQHFLAHAIDYFTMQDLLHFQYAIVSARVRSQHRASNVAKINIIYPPTEVTMAYAEYKDKTILEKMYMAFLEEKDPRTKNSWVANKIYTTFVSPLMNHVDIVIVCDRTENEIIDVLCKYIKKHFDIEVIDLNQLFSTGRIGSIYIDRKEIYNKAVDIRRASAREMIRSLETTRDGKLKLIGKMTKKEKIKKLEELGIKVSERDKNDLDKLLIDEWVENDNYDKDE